MNVITRELTLNADEKYKDFHSALIPNVDKNTLLGVRAPDCRRIAKKYAQAPEGALFMDTLPHQFYDEYITHGYMLGFLPREQALTRLKALLPYMDNWAVVDSCVSNLKMLFKSRERAYGFALRLLDSDEEFICRFGIVSLLSYYLDDEYAQRAINEVKRIHSDKFYVKMAQAWFFATALTKQYKLTIEIIEKRELDSWVHNKSIQKAKESLRVPKEIKNYLNTLKIK
ncbi:MAG: DNA alkylation repair protein [Clostridia bacterium]|nr:DNA alkylation repair protein [Clostridia bacterium]